jgi:hypothetical protein
MILYKFKKLFNVQKRKHTEKLIFCHLTNVIDRDYFLEPDLLDRDKYYSFAKIKNYYFERLAKEQLPFHYYVDRIGDEWEIMLGAPLNYRSQYLQDLINLGLLSPEYKDATLIVIRDNFELNIPDIRLFKTIGQKIIEPNLFLNRRNMNNSVFWFDELFDWKTFNEDKLLYNLQSKNRYRIKPMKYFDRITFNLEVLYFT